MLTLGLIVIPISVFDTPSAIGVSPCIRVSVDQFESVFNAASKPAHRYEPARYSRIAVITDLDAEAAGGLTRRLHAAFRTLVQSEW